MKRVIRRTKGELILRKELYSRLLRLGKEVLTGLGDTERRIQRTIEIQTDWLNQMDNTSFWSQSAVNRRLCTAAWLHPAGSALMYLHYKFVNQERGSPTALARWTEKLIVQSHYLASEAYGGRWTVVFNRGSPSFKGGSLLDDHHLATGLAILLPKGSRIH